MLRSAVHGGPPGFAVPGVKELPWACLFELPPGQVNRVWIIFRVLEGQRIFNRLIHDDRILGQGAT
ncbi:hypothetical protein D3C75_1134500 [compost metagenome]